MDILGIIIMGLIGGFIGHFWGRYVARRFYDHPAWKQFIILSGPYAIGSALLFMFAQ